MINFNIKWILYNTLVVRNLNVRPLSHNHTPKISLSKPQSSTSNDIMNSHPQCHEQLKGDRVSFNTTRVTPVKRNVHRAWQCPPHEMSHRIIGISAWISRFIRLKCSRGNRCTVAPGSADSKLMRFVRSIFLFKLRSTLRKFNIINIILVYSLSVTKDESFIR